MSVFVALFSGINVGGNRIVKMAELRAFFEELGFADVATYIQSGNVVFRVAAADAGALTANIEAAFESRWGFRSRIMVRDLGWLERLVANNPYPEVAGDHTKLHASALEREPTAEEIARLAERCTGPESFEVKGDVLVHDFIKPNDDDRVTVRTPQGTTVENLGRRASYSYQLEAFAAHVEHGAALPFGTDDAVANMGLIDAAYRAAGLQPR